MLEVSKWLKALLPWTTKELHQYFVDMIQETLKSIYFFKKWVHRTIRPLYFKKRKAAPTTARNQWGDLIKHNSWGGVENRAKIANSAQNWRHELKAPFSSFHTPAVTDKSLLISILLLAISLTLPFNDIWIIKEQ